MTQQEPITTDELTEDLPSLGDRSLLEWKRIYSFRSPAGHRYAVHIDGPTLATIQLKHAKPSSPTTKLPRNPNTSTPPDSKPSSAHAFKEYQ